MRISLHVHFHHSLKYNTTEATYVGSSIKKVGKYAVNAKLKKTLPSSNDKFFHVTSIKLF